MDTKKEPIPMSAESIFIRHSCEVGEEKEGKYRTALFVDGDGVREEKSLPGLLTAGQYDAAGAQGLVMENAAADMSAVIVDGGRYTLKNAKIRLLTESDGREVCDFIGLGSAVCAFNGARVDIEDSEIVTEGVAKCTVFADEGSDVVVKNSRLEVKGGTIYDGCPNCADFNYMVAPPWVLGLMGNARGTNLMGNKGSTVLVNTDVTAKNWGALSTDNGESNLLVVVDGALTVTGCEEDRKNPYFKRWGSGYGTYILGTDEDFRGVKMYAGTYIGIARDGNAVYRSSKGTIRVISPTTGEVLYEGEGKGEITELYSDAFGIMAHGLAELTLTEGTEMDTENAACLLRCDGIKI